MLKNKFLVANTLTLIIGLISFIYMACTQSLVLGLICTSLFTIAFIIRVYMQRERRKTKKIQNEAMSSYNGTLIDFIQNIVTVRKLNIDKFCEDKLQEKGSIYMKAVKKNEVKRSNTNVVSGSMIGLLYITVLVS